MTCPTRAPSTAASSTTSTSSLGVIRSATVSSSHRPPRSTASRVGFSPRMSAAVSTPSTASRSSTTSSSRTPRERMNSWAPSIGAWARMVAGLTRARSVITSSAGDSGVTRAACDWRGRRMPAPAPSSRIGSPWYCLSMTPPCRGARSARLGGRGARLAAPVRPEIAVQLGQHLAVHLALELDHRLERHPVLVPAPGVELGLEARAQLDVAIAAHHAQQVPDLLLAAVGAAPVAAHPFLGHLVAQPVARTPENADVIRLEADLLIEFAVHRPLRRLAVLDAALGKLPRVLVDALAPEHLVAAVGEDDADVRAIPVPVEHGHTT